MKGSFFHGFWNNSLVQLGSSSISSLSNPIELKIGNLTIWADNIIIPYTKTK